MAETGSTNADVAAAARAGAPEGLVVVAERQTAGRGRLGRHWRRRRGPGIAVSVLLRPGRVAAGRRPGWGWLPLLAGVALAEAVRRLAELDAAPEVAQRPAASDGAQVRRHPRRGGAGVGAGAGVVVGIGLNVTLRADELPANPTGLPATSLQLAGAAAHRPGSAAAGAAARARRLVRALARRRRRPGASGLREAYLAAARTIGRQVRVLLPGGARADRHGHRRGRRRPAAGARPAPDGGCRGDVAPAGDVLHAAVSRDPATCRAADRRARWRRPATVSASRVLRGGCAWRSPKTCSPRTSTSCCTCTPTGRR